MRGGDKKTLERLCRYITRDIRVQLTGINQCHDRYVALDLGTAVVPFPAAAWLFGGGLGALGMVKRRQKSA